MATIIYKNISRHFIIFFIGISLSSCSEFLTALATYSTTYNRVAITSIKLIDYSTKKPDGLAWDPLGGKPDIYLRIREGSGPFISKETYDNVQDGVQLRWFFNPQPLNMSSLTNTLTIAFYDEESGLNVGSDDYMGSVVFSPSRYVKGSSNPYPSEVTLISSSNPIVRVAVSLRWSQ